MKSISVPLYSRASDRSISECSFRWHVGAQGLEEAGASWFDIGHALHETFETGIERQWKKSSTYVKHGVRRVSELVDLGSTIMPEYLVSKHRPIDSKSLAEMAEHMCLNFYRDVIESPPEWMSHVYDGGWLLEHNVQVSPEHPEWEWKGGASTTIDALFLDPTGFVLVDWKTGRSRSSDPRQLQFYRYLLELEQYEAHYNVWGAFYHAEHGKWQIVDEYDPQMVERLIASSQVAKQAKPSATPTWLCDYCTARSVCPAFAPDDYEAHLREAIVEHGRSKYEFATDPTAG